MPKSANQKLKLLYLKKTLEEKTDEYHALKVSQIIEELARYEISAERKSIYDDFEALRLYGMDIASSKSKTTGYYLASRDFELPELKLLADAVASSKFITERKSKELIKKIEGLASIHEAKQLQRQVYVMGRVKTMNEKIYYNVDAIHQAIAENRQIAFKYFEYTVDKEKRYRREGEKYIVSPYAMSWDNENYYLIALYAKYQNPSHFRVDKMESIEMMECRREALPDNKDFNLAEYSKKVFSMFSGEEENIRLHFDNSLIGVVLDRFGSDVMVSKDGENGFTVNIRAFVSPTLLGWIFGFGENVKVLAPESLKQLLREKAEACARLYTENP